MEDSIIILGRVGETGANTVSIDLSEFREFGNGVYHLFHQRPTDTEPYEVENIYVSDGKLYWNVTANDVEYVGVGRAEVRLQGEDFLVKSRVYLTKTDPALPGM